MSVVLSLDQTNPNPLLLPNYWVIDIFHFQQIQVNIVHYIHISRHLVSQVIGILHYNFIWNRLFFRVIDIYRPKFTSTMTEFTKLSTSSERSVNKKSRTRLENNYFIYRPTNQGHLYRTNWHRHKLRQKDYNTFALVFYLWHGGAVT